MILSNLLARSANCMFNSKLLFSTVVKKKKMQLTLRTPYNTIVQDFTDFSRIITKTQQSTMVIQNRNPAALHILPPGYIKLKLTQATKGVSDQYMHTGGWLIIHMDNSCQINVMDIVEKKDVKADQIDKVDIKDTDSISGKYIGKARKQASKNFLKRLTQ